MELCQSSSPLSPCHSSPSWEHNFCSIYLRWDKRTYGPCISQNGRASRSSSPTINPVPPSSPLNHIPPKHYIKTTPLYFQRWWLHHLPGQPIPMSNHSFSEFFSVIFKLNFPWYNSNPFTWDMAERQTEQNANGRQTKISKDDLLLWLGRQCTETAHLSALLMPDVRSALWWWHHYSSDYVHHQWDELGNN